MRFTSDCTAAANCPASLPATPHFNKRAASAAIAKSTAFKILQLELGRFRPPITAQSAPTAPRNGRPRNPVAAVAIVVGSLHDRRVRTHSFPAHSPQQLRAARRCVVLGHRAALDRLGQPNRRHVRLKRPSDQRRKGLATFFLSEAFERLRSRGIYSSKPKRCSKTRLLWRCTPNSASNKSTKASCTAKTRSGERRCSHRSTPRRACSAKRSARHGPFNTAPRPRFNVANILRHRLPRLGTERRQPHRSGSPRPRLCNRPGSSSEPPALRRRVQERNTPTPKIRRNRADPTAAASVSFSSRGKIRPPVLFLGHIGKQVDMRPVQSVQPRGTSEIFRQAFIQPQRNIRQRPSAYNRAALHGANLPPPGRSNAHTQRAAYRSPRRKPAATARSGIPLQEFLIAIGIAKQINIDRLVTGGKPRVRFTSSRSAVNSRTSR